MKTLSGLTPLNQTELKISGGHSADLRAKHGYPHEGSGIITEHQVVDFIRGVWDGFTE